MKTRIQFILMVFTVTIFTSCYDRDIIDTKEFGHELPEIENLNYVKLEGAVRITWQIPANISPAFRRPLEVSIQKVENNIYREVIIVSGESTSRDIAVDPAKAYRFVVKLAGYLTEEAREAGKSDRVYSEGLVLEVE